MALPVAPASVPALCGAALRLHYADCRERKALRSFWITRPHLKSRARSFLTVAPASVPALFLRAGLAVAWVESGTPCHRKMGGGTTKTVQKKGTGTEAGATETSVADGVFAPGAAWGAGQQNFEAQR